MKKLQLGETHFLVGAIKPRRSFRLQATIRPILLEIAGVYAQLEDRAKAKKKAIEKRDEPDPNIIDMGAESAPTVLSEDDDADTGPATTAQEQDYWERMARILESDLSEIIPIVGGVFAGVTEDILDHLQRELLAETSANGKRLYSINGTADYFDTVMVARNKDIWILMWESVKLSYADFLGPLLEKLGRGGDEGTPTEE